MSNSDIEVGKTLCDPVARLSISGKHPDRHYRFVRKDRVEKRLAQGYETVQDKGLPGGIESATGHPDGTMHSTHDLVLMSTSRDAAEARRKAAADRSKARLRRDIESARDAIARAGGASGKTYTFGSATARKER